MSVSPVVGQKNIFTTDQLLELAGVDPASVYATPDLVLVNGSFSEALTEQSGRDRSFDVNLNDNQIEFVASGETTTITISSWSRETGEQTDSTIVLENTTVVPTFSVGEESLLEEGQFYSLVDGVYTQVTPATAAAGGALFVEGGQLVEATALTQTSPVAIDAIAYRNVNVEPALANIARLNDPDFGTEADPTGKLTIRLDDLLESFEGTGLKITELRNGGNPSNAPYLPFVNEGEYVFVENTSLGDSQDWDVIDRVFLQYTVEDAFGNKAEGTFNVPIADFVEPVTPFEGYDPINDWQPQRRVEINPGGPAADPLGDELVINDADGRLFGINNRASDSTYDDITGVAFVMGEVGAFDDGSIAGDEYIGTLEFDLQEGYRTTANFNTAQLDPIMGSVSADGTLDGAMVDTETGAVLALFQDVTVL